MRYIRVIKGEDQGHPFRGNQYTAGKYGNYRKPGKPVEGRDESFDSATEKLFMESMKDVAPKDIYQAYPSLADTTIMEKFAEKDEIRSAMKAAICKELSDRSGVPEGDISNILHSWAMDSNEGRAIHFQKIIAEEFGLPMNNFQRKKYSDEEKADFGITDKQADNERKVARAMYEYTQDKLASGPKYVKVFRGIRANNNNAKWFKATKAAGGSKTVSNYRGNVIESWSASYYTADGFASSYKGAVLGMMVPREAIFSTALTGLGCLNEFEYVIFGNPSGRPHSVKPVSFGYPG